VFEILKKQSTVYGYGRLATREVADGISFLLNRWSKPRFSFL